jgi:hypothetical protein
MTNPRLSVAPPVARPKSATCTTFQGIEMSKKTFIAAIAAAMTLLVAPSWAHGPDAPKHGGIVQSASDLGFELAPTADGLVLYIEDHGKPLSTQGASGKLTVLSGANKTEADMTPAGDNRLEAKAVKLASGAKAVAVVTLPSKKVVTVRFTAK